MAEMVYAKAELSRPEKEHDRGSAASSEPRPAFGPFAVRHRRRHRRSGRRRSGRRRSPPECCGGIRGSRPHHKTPSASPCTQDPLCLSPEDDLRPPTRERTCSRRTTYGPLRGRDPASRGWANPGPLRLSPSQGRTRGVLRRGSLRFPHRLTDPRGERERRSPAGPPNPSGNPSGKQEHRNAKTDEDR